MSDLQQITPVDTVTLPPTGQIKAKNVTFNVSCELMKNQIPASPIQPTQDISVVYSSEGRPLIFSIGTDRAFHLIQSEDASATGWTLYNLSSSLSGYSGVKTFDVTQDFHGKITVAVAMSKTTSPATDVFVADLMTNDTTKFDWTKFFSSASKIAGFDGNFQAEKIRMGTSDDGKKAFVVVSGNIAGTKYYYQIDEARTGAQKFEFPENVKPDSDGLMDISLGYAFGQRGIFFLYKIGDSETLECTTLATSDEGVMHYDYSPGNQKLPEALRNLRYNCIATPTGSQKNPMTISSDIYVGTDQGIFVFKDGKAASLQKVSDQVKDVHEIVVKDDGHTVSIWAMASPNRLYYISGTHGTTFTWNQAILFNSSAIHIAALRAPSKKANEVFLVNQDLSVSHYWQDPSSTLWQQRTIKVKDSSFLLDYNSFTTQIHLEDENGIALAGQNLKVTSSEWIYAVVNGLVYSLDIDTAATIPTDSSGAITIITMASDISSVIFHVEGDFFDKHLNIYPNGKIMKGLNSIKSGSDLKNAKTSDGKSVVGSTYNDDTLNGIADNVSQLNASGSQYVVGTKDPNNTFLSVEDKGLKHTGVLDTSHLPKNFAVGMSLSNGSWKPMANVAAVSLSSPVDSVLSFAGDVLHYLETAFVDGLKLVEKGVVYLADGASFVLQKAEQGLMLVLKLADKVFNIALKTLGCVFKALNWVLKLVGIDLTKILAWLGHLFGWDDIWETHKVIAAVMTSAVNYGADRANKEIEQWRVTIRGFFDKLESQIDNLILPPDRANLSPSGQTSTDRKNNPNASSKSPPANWSNYQMQHGGLIAGPSVKNPIGNPITQFFTDVIEPLAQTIATDVGKDFDDLVKVCTDPSSTLTNVLTLAKDLVNTIIDPLKTLVDGFLRFVEDIINDLRSLLADDLDIPFLSTFYKWVTELLGDEEDFTMINSVALVLAIPVTYAYKAIAGHAPFSDSSFGMKDPQVFHKLLDSPDSASPKANVRALSMSASLTASAPVLGAETTSPPVLKSDPDEGLSDSEKARARYSRIGGAIGAMASVAAGVAGLFAEGQDDAAGGGMKTADKFQLGFGIVKAAMTIPMPPIFKSTDSLGYRDSMNQAYALKCTAFAISTLATVVGWKVPKKAEGVVNVIVNGAVLILSLVADGIGQADGWTWTSDVCSNVGGVIQGGGQLFKQPEARVVGAGISYLGGSLVTLIHVIQAASSDDLVYVVNVGGTV